MQEISAIHGLVEAGKLKEAIARLDYLITQKSYPEAFYLYRTYIANKCKIQDRKSKAPYCLCINMTSGELDNFRVLCFIWRVLSKRDSCDYQNIDLKIFVDKADCSIEERIFCMVQENQIDLLFFSVEVISAQVPELYNFYKREIDGSIDVGCAPYGYKSGPNYQFFKILKNEKLWSYKYVLLCEVDCYPLSGHWLHQIFKEAEVHENFLVLGSPYRGRSKIDRSICLHLNGVAVYAVGSSRFRKFILEWESTLLEMVHAYPNIAYDWALDVYFKKKIFDTEWAHVSAEDIAKYVEFRENFIFSKRIINLAGEPERAGIGRYHFESLHQEFPGAALVHGSYYKDEAFSSAKKIGAM